MKEARWVIYSYMSLWEPLTTTFDGSYPKTDHMNVKYLGPLNSLRPSDAYMRQYTGRRQAII